jgi:DNA-binding transcriptional LysR family regulator
VECRLEGAFVAGPVNHPELLAACREELVLVTPRSIRSLDDLAGMKDPKTIVFRAGCSYRRRLDALLTDLGILSAQPLEFGSVEAIIGCVGAGMGVTLLPKGAVADAVRDRLVVAHELAPDIAEVQTVFIRRVDTYLSSTIAAFLQLIRPEEAMGLAAD